MFLSVKELELRKVPFEVNFAPGQIDFGEPALKQHGELHVKGEAELSGALEEIRAHGWIRGGFDGVCDRCLEPVLVPLNGGFDLSYRPDLTDEEFVEEKGIKEEDTEIGFYEGDGLELADVVREQVILWLPMHVVCREDCAGICPVCGQNRNQTQCDCKVESADERWAALKNI